MISALPRVAIAVRDMDRAVATFRDGLGLPVHEFAELHESLGIRMALCVPAGGSHIELMAPLDTERSHSRSLLGFLDRRGEGLFALMLNAPDPDTEAEELERRGLGVMPLFPEAGGRDIHPKNTHGVLIRIYPDATGETIDRELARSLGNASPRLRGITRVRIVVDDLEDALVVYRDRLGLAAEPVDSRTAFCRAPRGAAIELLAPDTAADDDPARFRRERGEGLYALVLETDDPARTRTLLERNGIILHETRNAWETDPGTTFGALLRIEFR